MFSVIRMKPELSIIIVNWNGMNFLPNCLKSIEENRPVVPFEVIVVDNASSDGSIEWLHSEQAKSIFREGNFNVIESKENLGFGRANNLAIEQTETPFVFLLNPDTIVFPQSIDTLLSSLKADKKVGICGPKLLNDDGSLQPSALPFPPSGVKFLFDGLQLYKLLPKYVAGDWLLGRHWTHDKKRFLKVISGAALMTRREMINETGAFDEKFHMYGEDIEWCLRVSRLGWKIMFEPKAQIAHLGGQSAIQRWGKNVRLREEEAFLRFQMDFQTPFQVMRNTSARIFVTSLHYLKSLIFGGANKMILKQVLLIQFKGFAKSSKNLLGK